jgi:ubiquinol-cytochrome c reductase cytochrome c subunit
MTGRRGRRLARWALVAVALVAGTLGLLAFASAGGRAQAPSARAPAAGDPAAGAQLFAAGCSFCHGDDARGVPGRGPSLRGVGAQAADFMLRTGRMPLAEPGAEPVRAPPAYDDGRIADLVAYVGSLGGPAIPVVDPARGDLARGRQVFTTNCAGCHQIVARGGIVVGGSAPALQDATPTQIAEAVRVGPWLMPRFSAGQIDQADLDAVTRYVVWTRHPDDRGGWGIGDIGPIPEGMVAWLVALAALLGLARLVGEGAR